MRQRRLAAILAVLALVVQALAPLAPARGERAVICGAGGAFAGLIDLASGQPVAPAFLTQGHDCCLAGAHCGACAPLGAEGTGLARAAAGPATRTAGTPPLAALDLQTPARARAPPRASQLKAA